MSNRKIVSCTACNSGWQIILGEERFCGWCGTPVQGFDLEVEQNEAEKLIYADESSPYHVKINVINTGFVPIKIDSIELNED